HVALPPNAETNRLTHELHQDTSCFGHRTRPRQLLPRWWPLTPAIEDEPTPEHLSLPDSQNPKTKPHNPGNNAHLCGCTADSQVQAKLPASGLPLILVNRFVEKFPNCLKKILRVENNAEFPGHAL